MPTNSDKSSRKPVAGKSPGRNDNYRDAIHVPIIRCFNANYEDILWAGNKIKIVKIHGERYETTSMGELEAIVDPFFFGPVQPGQEFWAWLRPGSVRSLWHEWWHNQLDK